MLKAVCPKYCPVPFCLTACPTDAISIGVEDKNIYIDSSKCHGCGICRMACITWSRDKGMEKKMPWLSWLSTKRAKAQSK